ncbi:glycine--tRNA ligase [Candidatus Woesearchaeota archaeon]|nr:glycine--tRNA ligase [Candidatus Woesearchaeota archaeon]
MTLSIEEMSTFCKKKGIVFKNSEIYNGLAGFFDFGPLGVELKNNVKQMLWHDFVQTRDDVVGIDGTIICHPRVWKASGHVDSFSDVLLECEKCKEKYRGDTLIEDVLKIRTDGMPKAEIIKVLKEKEIDCPKCKGILSEAKEFNLMFTTQVGAGSGVMSYLRPETAQLIFADFKQVTDIGRVKLPFGIAQIGKAFRNEISPRDFLFRSREFEQFEIEFFVHPKKLNDCKFYDEVKDYRINILLDGEKDHKEFSVEELMKKQVFKTKWHAYWLVQYYKWFLKYGIEKEHLRLREHAKEELAHYASACFDVEYKFPFGWKEIHGNADRGQFDLKQHVNESGKDMSIFDEETKEKVIPYVASEPSQGVERAMLAFLFEAYHDDKERGNVVLKLHTKLAPVKVGVFPLVNKLDEEARKIYNEIKDDFVTTFDRSGSIGRRYARADEQGIPFCITIDFDTLNGQSVTIRNRDTTKQERVKIVELKRILRELLGR